MLMLFIVLLALSGITAFPLRTETRYLADIAHRFGPAMQRWIFKVYRAVESTPDIVLYGTDWLAFSHLVIALFFIPVYIDPVRYRANLFAGMVACAGVIPLAFICGGIRGIPLFHQLIDCAFGIIGVLPLWYVYRQTRKLQEHTAEQ